LIVRDVTRQSIFLSTTFIDDTHRTPSSDRSWRAVSVLPSSLNVPVQRSCFPSQIQTPSRQDSR
jgi:hypothetical protein